MKDNSKKVDEPSVWDIVVVIFLALFVLVAVFGVVRGCVQSVARLDTCQTAGFVKEVRIGDRHVCVGVSQDGEPIAEWLEVVQARLEER